MELEIGKKTSSGLSCVVEKGSTIGIMMESSSKKSLMASS